MRIRKGVVLFLPVGTRIPLWVRVQDENVSIYKLRIGSTTIRALKMRGGDAVFMPGGMVCIKVPGSSRFLTFSHNVLEIRDAQGKLKERNYYCCKKCMTLSGVIKTSHEGSREGYRNLGMACENCGYIWTLENV